MDWGLLAGCGTTLALTVDYPADPARPQAGRTHFQALGPSADQHSDPLKIGEKAPFRFHVRVAQAVPVSGALTTDVTATSHAFVLQKTQPAF